MTAALLGVVASFAPWTHEELAALRSAYASGGLAAARAALPGRSEAAIYHKTQRLRVMRRRLWTADDDRQLRLMWDGDMSVRDIADRLGRSVATTYHRAQQLGLPLGCPAGWEYLTHAAERTGYDVTTLRRILAAHDVAPKRALTKNRKRRRRRGCKARGVTHVVWPGDVDAAVAAWLDAEPVDTAARRLGLCGETLARWLSWAGVEKPAKKKHRWRVSPAEIELAITTRRAMRSNRGKAALLRLKARATLNNATIAGLAELGGRARGAA